LVASIDLFALGARRSNGNRGDIAGFALGGFVVCKRLAHGVFQIFKAALIVAT
jgi:hypothetical protein